MGDAMARLPSCPASQTQRAATSVTRVGPWRLTIASISSGPLHRQLRLTTVSDHCLTTFPQSANGSEDPQPIIYAQKGQSIGTGHLQRRTWRGLLSDLELGQPIEMDRFNRLYIFYVRFGIHIFFGYQAIAVLLVVYGLITRRLSALIFVLLFIVFSAIVLVFRRYLLRLIGAHPAVPKPQLLSPGLLSFDFIDRDRLLDIATQANVDLEPTRSERSKGKKRSASAKGSIKVLEASQTHEEIYDEKDIYEHPHNLALVLRRVVTVLDGEGHLLSRLAYIPTVEVDSMLDRLELIEALRRVWKRHVAELLDGNDEGALEAQAVLAKAEVIGEEVAQQLSNERLVRAKRDEIERVSVGSFALIAGEWTIRGTENGYELRLALLHSAPEDPRHRNVKVPSDLNILATVRSEGISSKGTMRLSSELVSATVFGEVLDKSDDFSILSVWPICIFTQSS